jgi:hypothetical protein
MVIKIGIISLYALAFGLVFSCSGNKEKTDEKQNNDLNPTIVASKDINSPYLNIIESFYIGFSFASVARSFSESPYQAIVQTDPELRYEGEDENKIQHLITCIFGLDSDQLKQINYTLDFKNSSQDLILAYQSTLLKKLTAMYGESYNEETDRDGNSSISWRDKTSYVYVTQGKDFITVEIKEMQ